jgi:uncharacterized Tic20 family protein
MADPTPAPAEAGAPLSETEDQQWASVAHFGNVVGLLPALVVWLVFKDRGAKTRVEAGEALNWIINVTGAAVALWIVYVIFEVIAIALPPVSILATLVGLVIFAVYALNVTFAILAGIRVSRGGSYRYPINIRWIR